MTLSLTINALFLVSSASLNFLNGLFDKIGFSTPYSKVVKQNKMLKNENTRIKRSVIDHANKRKKQIVKKSAKKASSGSLKLAATFVPAVANGVLMSSVAYDSIELVEYCNEIKAIDRFLEEIDPLNSSKSTNESTTQVCASTIREVTKETAKNYGDAIIRWHNNIRENMAKKSGAVSKKFKELSKSTAEKLGASYEVACQVLGGCKKSVH